MLSIFLVQHLESTTNDILVLQYICNNKNEKQNSADAILRGLLFQLLRLRPELMHHILPNFEIQKEPLFSNSSIKTLWRIAEMVFRDFGLGLVCCIFDGLDECDIASLKALLKKIKTPFSIEAGDLSVSRLHLLLVCRDLPDFIPEILSDFPRIHLHWDMVADTEIHHDIDQVIDAKTYNLATRKTSPVSLSMRQTGAN